MTRRRFLAALAAGIAATALPNPAGLLAGTRRPTPAPADWPRYLAALAHVETGGESDPDNATGDGGRALGRYQIHRVYWCDAVDFDSGLADRPYEDVRDSDYAASVVLAYARRYAGGALAAGDWYTLARLHNGGPAGPSKKATEAYGRRVVAVMRDLE